ncbi:hypothetical protein evm_011459 [Chilo suppressalis]|nr:hypothetical protein evm_011459 [Chilo suppressalis]
MTVLDSFPLVKTFLGLDLKTGCAIIAALGIVHPMSYGCTIYQPLSYLLVTIWILGALYFAASIVLLVGVIEGSAVMCAIWVWYAMIFVGLMLIPLIIMLCVNTYRKQKCRIIIGIVAILWYLMTIYFVFVVNSYRKKLS